MKKLGFTLLIAAIGLSAFALPVRQEADIVDTAVKAGKFKVLVSLVKKAGLVATLKSPGPFTVLAPTDAAFAKLPKSLVAKLTANPALLKKVLTYHVISGTVMSTDLSKMSAKTVEGESINVKVDPKPMFNNASVFMADVKASNGVIHAIDTVLLPPSVAKMLAKK